MKIGITIGDINGIGPEVILKALSNSLIFKNLTPIIYGSYKALSYHKNIIGNSNLFFQTIHHAENAQKDKINLINCWEENINVQLGVANADGGKYAAMALDRAFEDIKSGMIDAIVTAPINKHAMNMSHFPYPGHTEYFTIKDNADNSLMLMVSDGLKIGLVTNHLPVADVAKTISKDRVLEKIKLMHKTLVVDFGFEKPIIGVLGLNPHASDDSTIGNEEEKYILPAIVQAKKEGIFANGPHPADGFFGSGAWKKCDGILAMFHDQGLIPFKSLSFGTGTNVTGGLSFVRTSPDHGTAYDIVGKNIADPSSFLNAIFTAVDMVKMRKEYYTDRENALKRREKKTAGIHE